jgi:hypothetical protein
MKNFIKVILITLLLVCTVGSVGAFDVGHIGALQCLIQCGICIALICGVFQSINKNEEDQT